MGGDLVEKFDTACFDLVTAADLLKKAEHDIQCLDRVMNSYDLFNFLCTLNHIPDWILEPLKAEALALKRDNMNLDLVRKLCNRSKHFKKKENDPDTVVRSGFGQGRFGKGGFGHGEPSYVVVDDSNNEINMLELAHSALETWWKFFGEKGLLG